MSYAAALGIVHRTPNAGADPPPGSRPTSGWLPAIRADPWRTPAGRIVGINAMIVGGLGFAVPTHLVERFVQSLIGRIGGGARAA